MYGFKNGSPVATACHNGTNKLSNPANKPTDNTLHRTSFDPFTNKITPCTPNGSATPTAENGLVTASIPSAAPAVTAATHLPPSPLPLFSFSPFPPCSPATSLPTAPHHATTNPKLNTNPHACESNDPTLTKKNGDVTVNNAASKPTRSPSARSFINRFPNTYVNHTANPASKGLTHSRTPNLIPTANSAGHPNGYFPNR
ncbi:MAG: hypothetical protein Fur0022_40670 [Anaerolineales bacterium]